MVLGHERLERAKECFPQLHHYMTPKMLLGPNDYVFGSMVIFVSGVRFSGGDVCPSEPPYPVVQVGLLARASGAPVPYAY